MEEGGGLVEQSSPAQGREPCRDGGEGEGLWTFLV